MRLRIRALVVFAICALPVVALAQALDAQKVAITARYPAIEWTTTRALGAAMRRGDVVLLDAREQGEYRVSHLRDARRIDPELSDVSSVDVPEAEIVVVYCSVGWRSAAIVDRFRRAGRDRVYNLEGGIFRWANEGRKLYQGEREVSRVHPFDRTWGRMLDADRRAPLE